MGSLEAVIFDLDGVLTETSHEHFLAWRHLAKKLGFDLSEEANEQLKGISRMESLEIILKMARLSDRFSENQKVELANEKNEIYKTMIRKFTADNLSPGALELLNSLQGNGIKIGLASVSHNAPFCWKQWGYKGTLMEWQTRKP